MKTIPVAVQMYTLREECEKDFVGTLKKVAELGFDGVEFAGFGGMSASEIKSLLNDLNLQAASCHVPLDKLKNELNQVIDDAKTIDCHYVVCPYIEEREEKDYKKLIQDLNEIGERCRKEGITLCYHNHDFELESLSDGRSALEVIFEETDENNVKCEFDIYWLQKAGENPASWIDRYKGRTPLVHLKDMTTDDERFFAELGTGGVDLPSILNRGEESGVQWWVVEQDESRLSPLESLEISMEYLKK